MAGTGKEKQVCIQMQGCVRRKKDAYMDAEEVAGNGSLNSKQQLFCVLYARCFNATKAYQKAYGCAYESAMVAGSNLLRNNNVREEIKGLNRDAWHVKCLQKRI